MNKKGILVVLSGFSGSGKGTIMRELMDRYSDQYALSISVTTRKPRFCEQDGRDYFFKNRTEFESMIQHKELIEYAEYVGNYYGTPCHYVQEQLSLGKDVILDATNLSRKRRIGFLKSIPDCLAEAIVFAILKLKNKRILYLLQKGLLTKEN